MNILVTGACGYKGTLLVSKLLSRGDTVNAVDIMWFGNYLKPHPNLTIFEDDIREPEGVWFDGVDAVIHLAAVANDPCADLSPKLTWEIGPLATMRVAELAIKHGVKQFLYASSASVYGISDAEQVTENLPLNPISDYNKSKMVTERVLMSYADQFALTILRPATVCGYSPRMRLDVSVNMLTMQALTKKKITVFGGQQTRPNIHIDDLLDLYLFFLEHPQLTGTYNAGFENLSILDIARAIQEKVPCEIEVTESNDPRSYRVSSDKLLKIGYEPKKNVVNAIDEIIKTYRDEKFQDEKRYYNIQVMKDALIA